MFKKNTWIVGLLAALAIMFIGCVDPVEEDNSGVETEIFNLQEIIADVDPGYIDDWGSVFKNTPFQKCGSPDVQVINDGGKKKLKIDNMQNGWGEGVDLYNNNNPDKDIVGVGFKANDEVYIKGTINPVGNGLKLTNGGGKPRFGDGWISGASFDDTFVLTSANIADIKGASPNALRISYADPDGDARKGTIIIEELIVKGKRKAGEGSEPPPTKAIPGGENYKVPASSGLDIYIDLSLAEFSELSTKPYEAKITAPSGVAGAADKDTGKLTASFTFNGQGVYIPFTPEVRTLIVNAAKAGYKFDVVINGGLSAYGTNYGRYGFSNGLGSNWDVTGLKNITAATDLSTTLALSRSADDLNGFIYNARPGGYGSDGTAIAAPYTLTINSIKVVLVAQGALTDISSIAFTIGKPGAGRLADKVIRNGSDVTGLVTWYPALPRSGRFEVLTQYRAEVAIFPVAGKSIPASITSATVSYDGTATGTITTSFDPYTRVAYTLYFEPTKAINELLSGKLWSMADWFKNDTKDISDPLMQAGGPTYDFDTTNKKITISNIVNSWDSIDIQLPKIDAGVDPKFWKVKIVVEGKVLTLKSGETAGTIIVGGAAGSYSWLGNKGNLAAGGTFTIDTGEIPANFITNNDSKVRIQGQDGKIASFEITKIEVTNLGIR